MKKLLKKMIFIDPYTVYGRKSTFAAEKKKSLKRKCGRRSKPHHSVL